MYDFLMKYTLARVLLAVHVLYDNLVNNSAKTMSIKSLSLMRKTRNASTAGRQQAMTSKVHGLSMILAIATAR